ncbi:uncharacterized protein NECHADRAFT_87460 [Fusarium vanettenii 77-13-4]|uniref:SnoaL-like domain-containing protein n=1 Tax=Fusarium vanettenii (strain ATCC MYA-4622 / CBS 123669 / FGSC 9596 / NRRL 45880 / 77-13-4) TaxID=660122 RepID=C7ZE66_FUSV7|nr:uncharacterized protein NECHADRAFT_87460 [Fusarium vanettenii 77-13-4]EEU37578.1 hypothetical protein NECHADRAFT_87460 [Fusarium vanettenii 77-13-4]
MVSADHIRAIFEPIARGDMASFWPHVEPDVDWTVKEFQQGTRPLSSTWAGPLHLVVQNIIVDGNQAAVELKAVDTTTKSGDPFPNEYTWVLGFNDNGKIATVRAYMDTDLVTRVIEKNS